MAGPFCGQVLGRHGRRRDQGRAARRPDSTRRARLDGRDAGVPAPSTATSARSTLDLKDAGTSRVLHRLVEDADVVLENYRPGVAERLGADYETLRAINPRLIYASISGFGQTGPYAQRPGFDLIAQGMSGVMSVTGEPDGNPVKCGHPGRRPLRGAVLRGRRSCRALHARERTGRGQQIDTSLFEGALALSIWETAELWATGQRAAAARLRAPADRALPGAAHARRLHHGGRQQPAAVGAAVRRRSGARSSPTTRASPPTTTGWRTGPSWSPSSRRRSPRATRTSGSTRCCRGGRARGPDPRLRRGGRRPAHAGARDGGGDGAPEVEGTVRGLGIPVKLQRHAGHDPAARAAARPAHRRDPAEAG